MTVTITITIPFPGPERARTSSVRPEDAARRPDPLRSALVSLGWAVAVEVVEDLVPGLGAAVALVRVVRVVCATGSDGRPAGSTDDGRGDDEPTASRWARTDEVAA